MHSLNIHFNQIKQFPNIHYRIDVSLAHLQEQIDTYVNEHSLDLNPDFQRGHVWSRYQQIEYMEFLFKNPTSGREIYFNHPNWMSTFKGHFVLVDGKQRLTAALKFLNNKIPIFNHYKNEWQGMYSFEIGFSFHIAKLKSRKEVLQWYLDFNSGGTPHSTEEIEKVKKLLEEERNEF